MNSVKKDLKISPDILLSTIGYSPVDNIENYNTSVPIMSKIVGGQIRAALQHKNILRSVCVNPLIFSFFHIWHVFKKK